MLRKSAPWFIVYGVISICMGTASAWPLDTADAVMWVCANTAATFCALCGFLLLLPRRYKLPTQIFIAMFAGISLGWVYAQLGQGAFISDYLNIFGTLFVLMLKLVIIPLIFVSVLCGVAAFGDMEKLGAVGVKTIGFFLLTTAIAVIIAIVIVNVFRPGADRASLQSEAEVNQTESAAPGMGESFQKSVLPTIISNPIMAGQNPVAVIFFAILLGVALAYLGLEGQAALRVFQSLDKAFISIIQWIMFLAPIGVFALMADVVAELGIEYMLTLAKYFFTVLAALAAHFVLLTCVICPVFSGVSPRRFLRGMIPAFQVSFSTSSSAATLPVSINSVVKRVGADENIANFVLPIGATINMDGTAAYVSVASIFIAQVYGVQLGFQQEMMVFLTAILVSVGTAGIPGASVGLIGIILTSIGAPLEGIAIIIGVDRLLDMSRTVVNVTGDCVGACVISRSEGLMGQPEE